MSSIYLTEGKSLSVDNGNTHSKDKQILKDVFKIFKNNGDNKEDGIEVINPKCTMWTERDTLIGVLRDVKQLSVCLSNNFYHIPAKYISEYNLPVKWIGIYQSKNLFGRDAGIRYIGKVKNCTCVQRRYITEISKDSNEYYYRFNVEKWINLDNVIEGKEIGFIRIFTNYQMLLESHEVPQLMLQNRFEHEKYTELKNAILAVQKNPELAPVKISWNEFDLYIELDDILLMKKSRLINMFSVYDFLELPLTALGAIRHSIQSPANL